MIPKVSTTQLQPIAVLGAGSWGTALALHLSRLGQNVRLWSAEAKDVLDMQQKRINQHYLPNHPFPPTLNPIVDLAETISTVKDILIAVPSIGFRAVLTKLQTIIQPEQRIVWVTKGLDENTGQLLHQVADELLGKNRSYAALSGPSFASEVAAELPTAVVIASKDPAFAKELAERFTSTVFRVYLSNDLIGVEIGGAVKNVMAIATGISDGMGLGTNARCALITRGLAEIIRLGTALGGQYETFTGLTGLGDLVLTCTDNQSRNRRFGLHLGKGMSAEDALREIGQVVEGKRNAELVVQLAKQTHIEMPIAEEVWKILQGQRTPKEAMHDLFSRSIKAEGRF